MEFHIDQSYLQKPTIGGCLHALEIPQAGGDTLFGNLCLAWDTLPPELKRAVNGRSALNIFHHSGYGTQSRTANDVKSASHRWAHPIVREHPSSGRRFLYVNRLMTALIEGLPENESDDILFRLFDHEEKSEFRYTHKWRQYDLLLWDNRCCIHARTDFNKNETRHLRRFSIRDVAS
jgi:taurine dioxygenase